MNVFFASLLNSIRRHLRDMTPFLMQVIGPIVMILIFGSVMQSNFSTSSVISPVKAALVNQDGGQPAQEFIAYLQSSSLDPFIHITKLSNAADARQQLQRGRFNAVIEVRNGYSAQSAQGHFNGIKTTTISGDKTNYQVISSIISGWKNNNAAIQIALKNGKSMNAAAASLAGSGKLVKDMPLSPDGRLPRAIDYYSVTMAVMTLVFTGYLALGKIQNDFLGEMKNRFLISPSRLGVILTGDIIGTTLMGFLQSLTIVLFTLFVYGANWGNNWGIVLGTLFLMTLFGQMLAAALTLGMGNANAAQGIIGALAIGLTFLAGGFYTSPVGGAVGKFLTTYGTPNSLAQTAIFGSVYGGSLQVVSLCMAILAALSILLLGLTIVFARRRIV